jgi:lipoyl-dependent peroxiredoxin
MNRHATVNWKGSGKDGKGSITTQSNVLNNTPYAYNTRYGNEVGTNPEELIAGAHASCFTLKLSFNLANAGFPAENIDTRCDLDFDTAKNEIKSSKLSVKARVPGITNESFNNAVEDAKKNCPVSKLLNTEISCEAQLE